MPLTTSRGYPYPTPADPVNVPTDIQRLAEAINNDVGSNKVDRTGDTMTGGLAIAGNNGVALRIHSNTTPLIDMLNPTNTKQIMSIWATEGNGATFGSEFGWLTLNVNDFRLQRYAGGYLQITPDWMTLSDPNHIQLHADAGIIDFHNQGVWTARFGNNQAVYGNLADQNLGVWWIDQGGSTAIGRSVSVVTNAAGATNQYVRRDEAACYDGADMTQYLRMKNGALGLIGAVRIDKGMTGVGFLGGSDYRMKNDLGELTDASAIVRQLTTHRLSSKLDPSAEFIGFMAHEVQAVLPQLVFGEKDAVYSAEEIANEPQFAALQALPPTPDPITGVVADVETVPGEPLPNFEAGVPKIQLLDTIGLVPVLTAALKEALGRIDTLETRLAALETA